MPGLTNGYFFLTLGFQKLVIKEKLYFSVKSN